MSLTHPGFATILLITHSPRLSPERAMRIKGEFFYWSDTPTSLGAKG